MKHSFVSALFAGLLLGLGAGLPLTASAKIEPLLIPGKSSLHQRLLVVPGARMYPRPDAEDGEDITPFTVFYVYDRQSGWVRVGLDRHGGIRGWVKAEQTIEWNQGLTAAFRDPVGHDRALLFSDRQALRDLVEQHDLETYQRFYDAAVQDHLPEDSPVVAIQPPSHIDIQDEFYLVPIRAHQDVFHGSAQARLLKVASVPLEEPAEPREIGAEARAGDQPAVVASDRGSFASGMVAEQPAPVASGAEVDAAASVVSTVADQVEKGQLEPPEPFTSGIVFVTDATLSMQPYIDRTRVAVRRVYDRLGDAGLLGQVNFGLVAFRDNVQAVPGLEYLSRTYVTLEQGRDPVRFFNEVDDLRAAEISSADFIEDVYAGVLRGIQDIDWRGHDARYLVLVTDAGAREPDDPLAGTGLSAASLRQMALDQGVAVFVLHLLTPSTQADQDRAKAQYRELSDYPGIGSLYYGVSTGDLNEFGQVLDTLAAQLADQVRLAAAEHSAAVLAERGEAESDSPEVEVMTPVVAQPPPVVPPVADQAVTDKESTSRESSETAANPQLAELQEKVAKLGHALRLKYFARREAETTNSAQAAAGSDASDVSDMASSTGAKVPKVFEAWVLDRDVRDPERRTLDVRVLLSRDQLSELHSVLKQVLEATEEGVLSPRGFLNELRSLAATLARDPARLGETTATTAAGGNSLAELGFMREYLEDLPYAAEVMKVSLEDWETWSAKRQIAFLNGLEEKINYYRALHDHTDLWVSLDGGPVTGDSVFPVALEMLP